MGAPNVLGDPETPSGPRAHSGLVWGHTPRTSGCFSPRGWEQRWICRWFTSPPSSSAVFFVPPSTLPSPWRAPSGGPQPPGHTPKRGHGPKGVTSARLATSVSASQSWVTAGSPPCHPFLGLLECMGGEGHGQGQLSPCVLGHLTHLLHPTATRDQHPVTICPFPPSLSVGRAMSDPPQHQQFPTCTTTWPYKQEVHCPKARGCPPRHPSRGTRPCFPTKARHLAHIKGCLERF